MLLISSTTLKQSVKYDSSASFIENSNKQTAEHEFTTHFNNILNTNSLRGLSWLAQTTISSYEYDTDKTKWEENIWKDTKNKNQLVSILATVWNSSKSLQKSPHALPEVAYPSTYNNFLKTFYKLTEVLFNNDAEKTKTFIIEGILRNTSNQIVAVQNDISSYFFNEEAVDLPAPFIPSAYNAKNWRYISQNYFTNSHFADLTVLYPLKKTKLLQNGKKIFSYIPQECLEKFNYFHEVNEEKFLLDRNIDVATKRTNYASRLPCISETNLISCNPELMKEVSHDFTTPLKMLRIEKFLSASASDDWQYETAATKKIFLKRPGTAIPVLYKKKVTYLEDNEFVEEEVYIACFLLNISLARLSRYTAPLHYIKRLWAFSKNGALLKYFDPEQYQSILNKKSAFAIKYSNANTKNYEVLERLLDVGVVDEKILSQEPLSINLLHQFTMTPKVDLEQKKQKNKIKKKFLRAEETLKNYKAKIIESSEKINYRSQKLLSYHNQIETLKNSIEFAEEQQNKSYEVIKEQFLTYANVKPSFEKLKTQYNNLSKTYSNTVAELIEAKQYSLPSFFKTSNSDYEILSIKFSYKENSYPRKEIVLDKNFDKVFTKDFSKQINIEEVVFQTLKPFKIVPDGNLKKAVVGGPWIVKATKNNLTLKLKDQSSFFGVSYEKKRLQIHPHSSKFSISDYDSYLKVYTHWSSACLGEAQPLIYNAFEKSELQTILIATSIWLKSANSSDYWGKHYKEFLPYSEYARNLPLSSTTTDLIEGIENETLQPIEGLESLEETIINNEQLATQQEELQPLPTITAALDREQNSQPVYVRYSARIGERE